MSSPEALALKLGELQGNVLRPYGTSYTHARYEFFRVAHAPRARKWLEGRARALTLHGEGGASGPRTTLNLAFTHAGLAALGLPGELLAAFPGAFREGVHERSDILGDSGTSAPSRWEEGLEATSAHVLVVVHARDSLPGAGDAAIALERRCSELAPSAADGLVSVHRDDAALIPTEHDEPPRNGRACTLRFTREHFGFADGCSQPSVDGNQVGTVGGGTLVRTWWQAKQYALLTSWPRLARSVSRWQPFPFASWQDVKLGEFVLGHANEDGEVAGLFRPDVDDVVAERLARIGENGTFMVYRKLAQHVDRFRRVTARLAGGDGDATLRLRASLVGRWPDGTPLALRPDAPDPGLATDADAANRFGYGLDPTGARCPLGAHVRRVNPRDALPGGGTRTKRHRIIRRGMPYGTWLDDGQPDEDPPRRGLVFVCFNASIERQFELIQQSWCNDGDALGLGDDPDVLVRHSPGPARFVDPSRNPPVLSGFEPFVTTRGAAYLFLPGQGALRTMLELASHER